MADQPDLDYLAEKRLALDKQADALDAANQLRTAEQEAIRRVREARGRFRQAIIDAHEAGVPYAELGRALGLTRQRVARIAKGTDGTFDE